MRDKRRKRHRESRIGNLQDKYIYIDKNQQKSIEINISQHKTTKKTTTKTTEIDVLILIDFC